MVCGGCDVSRMQKSVRVCETKRESNTAGVLRSIDQGATWQPHGQIRLDYPTHWIIEGCVRKYAANGALFLEA